MSAENVEFIRESYRRFVAARAYVPELTTDDFVWDMSNFHGWPEQQVYEGAEAAGFITEWLGTWDDWELELEELRDAGDKVVALVRQSGTSKGAGMPVEMSFAQVFTIRDGKQSRMEMYSDRDEALAATGFDRTP